MNAGVRSLANSPTAWPWNQPVLGGLLEDYVSTWLAVSGHLRVDVEADVYRSEFTLCIRATVGGNRIGETYRYPSELLADDVQFVAHNARRMLHNVRRASQDHLARCTR